MKVIAFLLTIFYVEALSKDENSDEEEEKPADPKEEAYYRYIYRRMKESENHKNHDKVKSEPFLLPGPYDPLPGRSHNGDYWPVFPFSNQYSGGLDLDPSKSRHLGGDISIPVPTWGMLDVTGFVFKRISDTTTKFGYLSHPVNMLGLTKEDFTRLMSDPSLNHNRSKPIVVMAYLICFSDHQPLLPLGKVPKSNVPFSCRPPMCNPYTQTFQFGMEHDIGGKDGIEGDINLPIPIGKDLAYRFPLGGNVYWDVDNVTVSYGHNVAPVDPYVNPYMFGAPGFEDLTRLTDRINDAELAPARRLRRSLAEPELSLEPGVRYPKQVLPYSPVSTLPYDIDVDPRYLPRTWTSIPHDILNRRQVYQDRHFLKLF
ncbi:hypothetical protein L596_020295 [Steinernema carpocapsae]|uniref:Uncharacterized protein n=1 Tax=Steinernema carpocapsae TaxID=34508 RepID=A0A4U5MT42_STECR|nr:hypothetical protein L596_020295 [Steinernema carpocapsae]